MSNLTYNQIKQIFNDISDDHYQLHNFGSGMVEDINTMTGNGIYSFPMLWIVPQQVTFNDNTKIFKIRVLVLDQDRADDTYRDDILSDTLSIMGDVLINFRTASFDYDVIGQTTALPIVQAFGDYVSGWYSDLDIETDFNITNDCDLPED